MDGIPLQNFISASKAEWRKLKIQGLREFVKRLNSEKVRSKLIELFLEKYAELEFELNTKTENNETIFHLACHGGQSRVVDLLMKKSADFKIDINDRGVSGNTAFHIVQWWWNVF